MDEEQKSAYEARNYFEFKYANGLPILGVQVDEVEALRRAKHHVELYHYKIAMLNADYLIDNRTETEIAGIQLMHIPVWKVGYIYRPRNLLRHFYKGQEKRLLIDGHSKGVLKGQLAMIHRDKVKINGIITGICSGAFLLVGLLWHPAFFLVAVFAMIVSILSFGQSMKNSRKRESEELQRLSASFENNDGAQISA